ncbi:MAG: hypothetical protein LUC97_08265 [Clostridiales bacterium]|nr:hypothetical protein [Clostridiales bacterium]
MKIKKIVGFAIALGAALVMSVAVNAATEIKAGDVSEVSGYIAVPIELSSTELSALYGYEIIINYDSTYYSPYTAVDGLTYSTLFGTSSYGSMTPNLAFGDNQAYLNWYVTGASYPNPTAGTVTLATVYFSLSDTTHTPSSNDFTINRIRLSDTTETQFYCTSYFTFDVTGDLGGNKVVALYASTDGGSTKQKLEYYTSTDWEDGTEYAEATTSFLVAVENETDTSGASVVDITIYGELEDGTYVALGDYTQEGFLVQTFK